MSKAIMCDNRDCRKVVEGDPAPGGWVFIKTKVDIVGGIGIRKTHFHFCSPKCAINSIGQLVESDLEAIEKRTGDQKSYRGHAGLTIGGKFFTG